ncbi:hypothetical protein TcBrA4_0118740 [Trypanosoma cruzi]|nr:hypothetical protein TcBrA4_0118740 [Trypanosoma cruzi]
MHGISAYPPERAVFLQEQANDSYNAAVYFFAKYVAEIPFQMLFPTVLDLITYFMMHLYRSPGAFFVNWFILVLLATFGYTFGLMFATFFESSTTAFAIVPVIFLPMLVVAGLFANTQRTGSLLGLAELSLVPPPCVPRRLRQRVPEAARHLRPRHASVHVSQWRGRH